MPRKTTTANETIKMGVKLINDNASLPKKGSVEAACYDIQMPDDIYIPPHTVKIVGTGLVFDIPEGYRVDVFLRSSIAAHTNVRLANAVGKIDSDYKGEVKLILENTGGLPARFYRGDRICQFEINKDTNVDLMLTDDVRETERGEGGIGSTNVSNNEKENK